MAIASALQPTQKDSFFHMGAAQDDLYFVILKENVFWHILAKFVVSLLCMQTDDMQSVLLEGLGAVLEQNSNVIAYAKIVLNGSISVILKECFTTMFAANQSHHYTCSGDHHFSY